MKRILLTFFVFTGINVFAQSVIFEDSFETYDDFIIEDIGDWTNVDLDGLFTYGFDGISFDSMGEAKAFQIFNSTTTSPPMPLLASSNWTARTGSKAAVCFSGVPEMDITANNDWLITPQIQLAASGNVLSFWAKSCDSLYGNEKFRVGISTTNTESTSFTIISAGDFVLNPPTAQWVEYTYNLDNYQGLNVYIAINCISDDQFGLAIDDFKVSVVLSSNEFFNKNLSLSPNPAHDVLNLLSSHTFIDAIKITDLNGRVVKNMQYSNVLTTQVNVADLMTGMYIISVETSEGTGTSKFIKK
jgi:hypothetical protein